VKKKVTSNKKKEKASLDDFSWLVPRRTRRNWVASLMRDWTMAKAWLRREIGNEVKNES
jgi:hypothetical protein